MKSLKLGTKLLFSFLAVGVIPFAIIAGISWFNSSKALRQGAFNQLEGMRGVKKAQIENFLSERQGDMGVLIETVRTLRQEAFSKLKAVQTIKKNQIENYFGERLGDVNVLSTNNTVISALAEFEKAFEREDGKIGGPGWKWIKQKFAPWLKQYKQDYGYYDLMLINLKGTVLYSVAEESDMGQNLAEGKLRDSVLAKAFRGGLNGVSLQDFEPYAPSNNKPCAFVAAPIKNEGKVIGVVSLQLSLDAINRIMQERTGLGKTGEVYLVGSDKRMRSNSFLDPKGHSVEASFAGTIKSNGVDTEAARKALAGAMGAEIVKDYNGNPVLSAYAPLKISGLKWAILAEIDVAEAFSPVDQNGEEFYKKYTQQYGYYDLFLVNPDGYVFYTVAKESDYKTNLITGKYKDSNLGDLIRGVLGAKNFGMADFAPYAPSKNEPCAFIAQPVLTGKNIDVVVGLQLSLAAINKIMQQRVGMGKTGETYLVGPDKLMRSDSFLDPTNHSVKASFAKPEIGKVDTVASREALAGTTAQKIIMDYNGNPVLSAYAPIKMGQVTWALIAEIDESEALAAVKAMEWIIAIVALVGVSAIVLVALVIGRSISKPISSVVQGLTQGGEQIASAANQVSSSSQTLASGASQQAASLEETSSSIEELASMARQNNDNAQQANGLMQEATHIVINANSAMKKLRDAMAKITLASEETGKIIKTIDEIAFQTNLLALNAAVEAARAGEAGAGFAVVADEVRNLALRAAEAAKNTSNLIEQNIKNIKEGSDLVVTTDDAFSQVEGSARKVGELVEEIAAASKEQTQGIEQINKATSDMDSVTQQVAANAEESAAASEELSAQAETMHGMVEGLAALVNGAGASRTARPAKRNLGEGGSQKRLKSLPVYQDGEPAATPKKAPNKAERELPLDDDFKDF